MDHVPIRKTYYPHFRFTESGELAYFASPLGKRGYLIPDAAVEARLLSALRWSYRVHVLWVVVTIVALTFVLPDAGPALGVLGAFAIVVGGFVLTELILVRPKRRDLRSVSDTRGLLARYKAAYFATPRDGASTLLGYAAGAVFFVMAVGFAASTPLLICALLLGACVAALWLFDRS